MKYNCEILNIIDEEIIIKIGDSQITGFSNNGTIQNIGDEILVDIQLFDDLKISETDYTEPAITKKDNSFAYSLYGVLDVDSSILKSKIDFKIDKEELFDYGYLDGKNVKVDVVRIDFDFDL